MLTVDEYLEGMFVNPNGLLSTKSGEDGARSIQHAEDHGKVRSNNQRERTTTYEILCSDGKVVERCRWEHEEESELVRVVRK